MKNDIELKECRYNTIYKTRVIAALTEQGGLDVKRPHEMKINILEAMAESRGINVAAIIRTMPKKRRK